MKTLPPSREHTNYRYNCGAEENLRNYETQQRLINRWKEIGRRGGKTATTQKLLGNVEEFERTSSDNIVLRQ